MPRGLTPGLALMTTTWQPRCVPSSRSPWRSVGGEDRPPLIEASGTPCGAPTSSSPTLLSLSYQSGPGGRCRDNSGELSRQRPPGPDAPSRNRGVVSNGAVSQAQQVSLKRQGPPRVSPPAKGFWSRATFGTGRGHFPTPTIRRYSV